MKTNLKANVTWELLAPELRLRFTEIFRIAAPKSFFQWHESTVDQAQVVFVDKTSNFARIRAGTPSLIFIGGDTWAIPGVFWVKTLDVNFAPFDLVDLLDRAAVFLLDWEARGTAPLTASSATRYRLKSWIFLGAPYDSGSHITALALLARQQVTVLELISHSGLDQARVEELLHVLHQRRLLQIVFISQLADVSSDAEIKPSNLPPKSFWRRLSSWISGNSGT